MLVTVFCCLLFHLIEKSNADYVPNITITLNEKKKGSIFLDCNVSETYTLLENVTAEVIVIFKNKHIEGDCHSNNNNKNKYLSELFKLYDNSSNIHKSKFFVKHIHNFRWECNFLVKRDLNDDGKTSWSTESKTARCVFNVHVRQIESPVTTKVDNIALNTTRTDLSVSEYDAVGYYDYEAGESVRVACEKKSNETFSYLEYNFYGNQDELVMKGDGKYHISFDTVLKSEYNNGYWECILVDNGVIYRNVLSKIRIYLRLQTSFDHFLSESAVILSACVIIAIVMLIVYWKYRNNKRNVNAANHYANISENEFSVRPIPTDCHEYTEILDKVDNNGDAYAVIYNTTDCLYTAPVPKSQRNKNTPEYSNIHDKSYKDHGGLQQGDEKNADIEEDIAYAEVMPKSENENCSKKYANVCNSARYVNTDANEYAEPAYCQAVIKD